MLRCSRTIGTSPCISTALGFRTLSPGIDRDSTFTLMTRHGTGGLLGPLLTSCHIIPRPGAKGSILQILLLICFSKQVFRAFTREVARVFYQCMSSPELVPYGNDAIVYHCSCNIVVNFERILNSEQIPLPDFLGLGTRPAQVNSFCLGTCPSFYLFGDDAASCAQGESIMSPPTISELVCFFETKSSGCMTTLGAQ